MNPTYPYIFVVSGTFIKSGLKTKRAGITRQSIEAKTQIDKVQADLFYVDTVLRLYGEEPEDIPLKRGDDLPPYFAGLR